MTYEEREKVRNMTREERRQLTRDRIEAKKEKRKARFKKTEFKPTFPFNFMQKEVNK